MRRPFTVRRHYRPAIRQSLVRQVPPFTIGSSANVIPGCKRGPLPAPTARSSALAALRASAVPHRDRCTHAPRRSRVARLAPWPVRCRPDGCRVALRRCQPTTTLPWHPTDAGSPRHVADRIGPGGIAHPSFVDGPDIDADDVAGFQPPLPVGNPMHQLFIDRSADRGRVVVLSPVRISQKGRDGVVRPNDLLGPDVQLAVVTPGFTISRIAS